MLYIRTHMNESEYFEVNRNELKRIFCLLDSFVFEANILKRIKAN
jgi:hypothetical protein